MNRVKVNQTLELEGNIINNITSEEGVVLMETGETITVASGTEIIDSGNTSNIEATDIGATETNTVTEAADIQAANAENSAGGVSEPESATDGIEIESGDGVDPVEGEIQENADLDLSGIEQEGLEGAVSMEEDYLNGAGMEDPTLEEGMYVDPGMEAGMADVKDPLLSSWVFVIGVSVAVLFVSIALGAFLAKRKIKKGIDLYED